MFLSDFDIKIKYQSLNDNPVEEFYVPVLSASNTYKRAVGYFSSRILLDYTVGLRKFLKNEGIIKLIISPFLSNEDILNIKSAFEDQLIENVDLLFKSYLEDNKTFASGKLLLLLLKMQKIEIKVAVPKNDKGLFHDKIGIFQDAIGNKIAIIGSNNETSASLKYNLESFNTFCSWKNGQEEYVIQHESDFDLYWNQSNPNIVLFDLEEAISKAVIKLFETDETVDELLLQILVDESDEIIETSNIIPYDYQIDAVNEWFKNYKGIFKFATGTGKTKTAIYLMERLEEKRNKNFFIIVVPDKTLVNQWNDELIGYNKHTLRCFSDSKDWHIELHNLVDISSIKEKYNYYIIVTNDSYNTDRFQREIILLDNEYLLVVDECHTWGTESMLSKLPNPNMILGLSATPELFFSKNKTERLLNFFGGIVFEYNLEQAIKDGKLVEYYYYPHMVEFTEQEKEDYQELTKKIVKIIGYDTNDVNDRYSNYGSILEMLLFKRSRIIYGATNKLSKLSEIVRDMCEKGNLLIYCGPTSYKEDFNGEVEGESLTQLQAVNKLLASKDIKFAQYTSVESEVERLQALDSFKKQIYSTLVAIKCLDEGVNIPQIERAVILASSTNPREFVQRRGRILRTSPGKEYAEIHDFVVSDPNFPLLNKRELARVYEFGRIAKNKESVLSRFKEDIDKYVFSEGDSDE